MRMCRILNHVDSRTVYIHNPCVCDRCSHNSMRYWNCPGTFSICVSFGYITTIWQLGSQHCDIPLLQQPVITSTSILCYVLNENVYVRSIVDTGSEVHVDCIHISTQLDLDSCSHIFPDRHVMLMAISDIPGPLSRVCVSSNMTSVMFRITARASTPHKPDSQTKLQNVQCMATSTVTRNYGMDCCSCVVVLDHTT